MSIAASANSQFDHSTDPVHGQPNREMVQTLREQSLHRLIAAAIVAGMLWFAYVGVVQESIALRLWSGPVFLVTASLCAIQVLARWGFRPAVYVYLAGVTGSILLATWAYDQPAILLLLSLPAGVAGLLIGTGASLGVALLLDVGVLVSPLVTAQPLTPSITVLVFISTGLTVLLLWVATYPLRIAVDWAWTSYDQARQKTQQAQEHRAHLTQVLKDLDAANRRLKAMAAELERARRAALEARRLKGEFAANISHELRTPLNLIIGFSEMMARAPYTYGDTPLPVAYRGDVQAIYRNARHLSALVDDVLDLSQIEAGRMGLLRSPLSIADVVAEAVDTVSSLYRRKKLWLRVDLPADLPSVEADRTRLRQVLINLLNNAARFTPSGGVTIAAEATQKEVTVRVTDTGSGIDEADLPAVFQEFSRLNSAVRDQAGGSGLGLTISKKFVELHGGHMGVTSEKGVGTTFSFSLPLQEDLGISWHPPQYDTWARLAPVAAGERKTVAVLADGPATARFFERYLDTYSVVPVTDRQEAWRVAAQESLHALVVVAQSGEAGWLELRQAREGLPNVPVLVCTLRGGPTASRPAGVASYLVKPITQERFLAVIEGLGDDVNHLLLVDDDPEVVRLLDRMIRLSGRTFRTSRAYSGAQALALLQEDDRPDAVLLDLLMPEVDGYTVIEHMQAAVDLRTIPVVVITARGLEDETVTTGLVGMTKREGFSIGDTMRSLKASLDILRPTGASSAVAVSQPPS